MPTYTITIKNGDEVTEVQAEAGQRALHVIQDAGIPFLAPCGGNGKCGKCLVYVHEGEGSGLRLACQTEISDNMILELGGPQTMIIEGDAVASSYQADGGKSGLGVALDIGTTTLACRMFDLGTGKLLASAARINPQAVWGADVISRISASVDKKLPQMTEAVLHAVDLMVEELLNKTGHQREEMTDFTLAGNTVMEHIAAGLPPDSIGFNPFTPLSLFGDYRELKYIPCPAWFAPCVASYVGGDISAGLIACDVHKSENPEVLIDLGTNGELSLGSRHGIVSCATAAGPVFEGANIFFGMPALPGAISEVWEEGDRLAYNTIGDAEPKGICGTGLIDAVAYMLRKGLVDETGYLLEASECPEHAAWLGQENSGSVFYLTADHRIYITQRDIRNIQLGKSAVYSGLMVLLDEAGLDLQGVTKLFIAGGFGKKLNLESAATVGIIPRAWLDRAVAVGNSSVEGASAALLSAEARQDMLGLWDITKYIELSITASFNDYFVENMMFPEA